jgi:hypothetical protein
MQATMLQQAAAFHKQAGIDLFAQDLNWHAVQGTRMGNARDLLTNVDALATIFSLHVVLEALNFFAMWLVVRGRSITDVMAHPPLMAMTNPIFSPVVFVRQYLSACLQSAASLVSMLCSRSKCTSTRAWIIAKPAAASRFRRMLLTTDA